MFPDDWHEETRSRLATSRLFVELKKKCEVDSAGPHVLALVDEATYYAFQKTKTILKHMGEFTLHDGDHLFRVLTLMETLLSDDQLQALTVPELMLLILSAFFHDIGMAAKEADVQSWKKIWDSKPTFESDEDKRECDRFLRFCSARPDRMSAIAQFVGSGNTSAADLAKSYLIADYIRVTHAHRAREIIKQDWQDRIRYRDVDLAVEFANICFSHNEDASSVLELDKSYLCGPGVYACLPLVAILLRVADLLDFDGKRTPEILFSHLFVRHPVSLSEWKKHRAVEAWDIGPTHVQFHAKCAHPAIQASIHAFCDLIDRELSACSNVISDLNEYHKSKGRKLALKIAFKVDRSKIETKKNIDGTPEFTYRETQFNLSKRQVIDLLMGTKLYGSPRLALRELLQNSIDACLLRAALEKSWGNLYQPSVAVRYLKEGSESYLEVVDNGTGMDQHIVDSYYSKVGASFYKSNEFYELRAKTNAEYVPTSRFGIGILSCFMVADTILVETRRLYAPHESSEPLNISIEGQESIFWIRKGTRQSPGTTTRLILRKADNPWDEMSESEFISSIEDGLPNPPFAIDIETNSEKKKRDQNSFMSIKARSIAKGSWDENKNVREIELSFDDRNGGFVGSALVAILQSKGKPVDYVDMSSRSVSIDGESYDLSKTMTQSGKEIETKSTTISIDEDGTVDTSSTSSNICDSRSRLSLHGIEVPMSLFPRYWESHNDLAKIEWPFPMLIVVDVRAPFDLDLNSARTQVLLGDRWNRFEEALCRAVLRGMKDSMSSAYWKQLVVLLEARSKSSRIFRDVLAEMQVVF